MAIASITAWLESSDRDFFRGKMLYEQYGSDKLILTIIRTGSSTYHFQKLLQGLEAVNELSHLEPKQITYEEPKPVPEASDKWDGAPDPILEVRNEKNRRYAQARQKFEMLRVMDSEEHRRDMALTMMDDLDFVNEAWSVIDEWREKGTVRDIQKKEAEMEVSELSLKELIRKSENLKSYISKDKKALVKATEPRKQVKIQSRLEMNELKLAEMKKRIEEMV